MSERTEACSVDELPLGAMKLVPVGAYDVGVCNVAGSFDAIANYCSHEGARCAPDPPTAATTS